MTSPKHTQGHTFRAAVVQETPVFFDVSSSLDIVRDHLKELHKNEVRLVLFPESFLPGYPRGMTFGANVGSRSEPGRELWMKYWHQSIQVDDETSRTLGQLAKEYEMYLVMGVTEKDDTNQSLYCSLFYYGPDGKLIGRHRKIKPTGTERVIWAEGDGTSLTSIKTQLGRIGGLICWENYMPEARMAVYRSGIDIYLAPTADARDTWTATMRHIACESRCYVLSANQYFESSHYPDDLTKHMDPSLTGVICRGGSMIVSPYGEIIGGPLYNKAGVLTVDIDMDEIIKSRMDFDPIGHYSRPDIFARDLSRENL